MDASDTDDDNEFYASDDENTELYALASKRGRVEGSDGMTKTERLRAIKRCLTIPSENDIVYYPSTTTVLIDDMLNKIPDSAGSTSDIYKRNMSWARRRCRYIPSVNDIKYFPSPVSIVIDKKLAKIDSEDTLEQVQLFFECKDIIGEYDGAYRGYLDAYLSNVCSYLKSFKAEKLESAVSLLSSIGEIASFEAVCSTLPDDIVKVVFNEIYHGLRNGEEPKYTKEKACILVDQWRKLARSQRALPLRKNIAINLYNPVVNDIIKSVKDLFSVCEFKKSFLDVIRGDKERFERFSTEDDELQTFISRLPLPYNCICGPSGSGKSTFAMHMCCEESLAVYLLFSRSCIFSLEGAIIQPNNVPFMGISEVFIHYLDMDSDTLGISEDFKRTMAESRFPIIGLIVALVQELDRLKSLAANADKTWLELEANMQNIAFVEMNGVEAYRIISQIQSKYSNPITFYVDNVFINEDKIGRDMRNVVTLRNVLQCLGITAVFLGSDMKICSKLEQNPGSILTPDNNVFCNVFTMVPRFDAPRFECLEKNVIDIHHNHPHVVAFVKFLCVCREFENPWLISLALDFLEQTPYSSPDEYFDKLFCNLFTSFGDRKEYFQDFLEGQSAYFLTFKDDDDLKYYGRQWCTREGRLRDHFGQFNGISQDQSKRYIFSLLREEESINFVVDTTSQDERSESDPEESCVSGKSQRLCRFEPHVLFVPFDKAPLIGLTAFGFGPLHYPMKLRDKNIQIYNAMRELGRTRMSWHSYVGCIIRTIARYSCMYSSRINGARGAPFPSFFQRFVESLMPYKKLAGTTKVLIEDTLFWSQFRIPFISPMINSNWNEGLVEFLETVYGDDLYLGKIGTIEQDPESGDDDDDEEEEEESACESEEEVPECLKVDWSVPVYSVSKDIPFYIECMAAYEPLQNEDINIILEKKLKRPQLDHCQLFIIIALRFKEDLSPCHQDFRLWRLVKKQTSPAPEKGTPVMELIELPDSCKTAQKQVILVDLKTIYEFDSGANIDSLDWTIF